MLYVNSIAREPVPIEGAIALDHCMATSCRREETLFILL